VKYATPSVPYSGTTAQDITQNVAIKLTGGVVDRALVPGSVISALQTFVHYLFPLYLTET